MESECAAGFPDRASGPGVFSRTAAVSAARAGARTTLVEYGGKLGGMWTLGLLSPFFDNHHHDGLNRELREALQARGCWGGLWDISFDPTEMAMLLDELALDAGIDILFYTMATEPIMEERNCFETSSATAMSSLLRCFLTGGAL